jgi:hypothetical protein
MDTERLRLIAQRVTLRRQPVPQTAPVPPKVEERKERIRRCRISPGTREAITAELKLQNLSRAKIAAKFSVSASAVQLIAESIGSHGLENWKRENGHTVKSVRGNHAMNDELYATLCEKIASDVFQGLYPPHVSAETIAVAVLQALPAFRDASPAVRKHFVERFTPMVYDRLRMQAEASDADAKAEWKA